MPLLLKLFTLLTLLCTFAPAAEQKLSVPPALHDVMGKTHYTFPPDDEYWQTINEYMGHGKRVRPLLVFLVGTQFGKQPQDLLPFARIVEWIHLASLFHDDVIDESETRREKITLWKATNPAVSLLAGNRVLSRAFAEAVPYAQATGHYEILTLVPQTVEAMTGGEFAQFQLKRAGTYLETDWNRVADAKTGRLFGFALMMPAFGQDRRVRDLLVDIGIRMGRMFQAQDDLNDVEKDQFEGNLNIVLVFAAREQGATPLDNLNAVNIATARELVTEKLKREGKELLAKLAELDGYVTHPDKSCAGAMEQIALMLSVPRPDYK